MKRYITVEEALKTEGFADSRVVSGHNGLKKRISHITVAEVPDSMEWLKGGELVVTTAYYIQNNPQEQERWIQGLIDNDAAALAIKTSRFIGITPPRMKAISNIHDFPIIELPHLVTWPQIIEGVSGLILNRQAAYLQTSEDIHKSLTKLVIESKGLESICLTISNLVNNPVILCDQWFNGMASGGSKKSKLDNAAINACLQELSDAYLRPPQHQTIPARNNQLIVQQRFHSETLQKEALVYPITVENEINSYLIVIEQNGIVDEADMIALEHGATVIALELLKQRASFEAEERLRLDILQNLLEHADLNDESFRKKAHIIGLNLSGSMLAIILSGRLINFQGEVKPFASQERKRLIQRLTSHIQRYDPRAFLVMRYDDMVGLIHIESPDQSAEEAFIDYMQQEIEQINNTEGSQLVIAGIGTICSDLSSYKRSYTEAQLAVDAASAFSQGSVVGFSRLGYNRLLLLINDREELYRYCADTLGPLLENDKEGVLLETLSVYLACNGNRNEISRTMFLHVNTVNYRISKIEELLKMNLKSIETRTTLFFALEIYRGMNKKRFNFDNYRRNSDFS